jgi:hypothetical protein
MQKKMIRIVIFEPNQNPYISEISGTSESLRNAISEGASIRLAYKQTNTSGIVIVHAENGLSLRLKQNSHAEDIVGTFAVCKYVDNELVDFDRGEIEKILTAGLPL